LLGDEIGALSVITVSELLHGVHRARGRHRLQRHAFVEQVLADYESVPITHAVAVVHARLWSDLARRGRAMAAHDLWIAATALAHGYGVGTLDRRDFGRVPGLRVVTA
jgi:predicted nucleic acid-binding protein